MPQKQQRLTSFTKQIKIFHSASLPLCAQWHVLSPPIPSLSFLYTADTVPSWSGARVGWGGSRVGPILLQLGCTWRRAHLETLVVTGGSLYPMFVSRMTGNTQRDQEGRKDPPATVTIPYWAQIHTRSSWSEEERLLSSPHLLPWKPGDSRSCVRWEDRRGNLLPSREGKEVGILTCLDISF